MLAWSLIAAVVIALVLVSVGVEVLLDLAHKVWSDAGRGE